MAMRASRIARQHRQSATGYPYSTGHRTANNAAIFGYRDAKKTAPSVTVSLRKSESDQSFTDATHFDELKQLMKKSATKTISCREFFDILKDMQGLLQAHKGKAFHEKVYEAMEKGSTCNAPTSNTMKFIQEHFSGDMNHMLPMILLTQLSYIEDGAHNIEQFLRQTPGEALAPYLQHYALHGTLTISDFGRSRSLLMEIYAYTLLAQAVLTCSRKNSHQEGGCLFLPVGKMDALIPNQFSRQTLTPADAEQATQALLRFNNLMSRIMELPDPDKLTPKERFEWRLTHGDLPYTMSPQVQKTMEEIKRDLDEMPPFLQQLFHRMPQGEMSQEETFQLVRKSFLEHREEFSVDNLLEAFAGTSMDS